MEDQSQRGSGRTFQPCDQSLPVLAALEPRGLPDAVKQSLMLDNASGYAGMKNLKVLSPLPDEDNLTASSRQQYQVLPKGRASEARIKAVVTGTKADFVRGIFVLDEKSEARIQQILDVNAWQPRGKGSCGLVTSYRDFIKKSTKAGKEIREQEIVSMFRLDHPNICKVFAIMCSNQSLDIIMEDAGQPLQTFFDKNWRKEGLGGYYGMVQDLACQGFRGLEYMHGHRVFHLDLKPDNILVKANSKNQLCLVIADFGSSLLDDQQMSFSLPLTPQYWAPELCDLFIQCSRSEAENASLIKFPPQASFDTYAMGLTVYFMCSKRHLMIFKLSPKGASNRDLPIVNFVEQMKTHATEIPSWATEGPFDIGPLPEILDNLLRNTLHDDLQKRFTDSQAVKLLSGKQQAYEEQHEAYEGQHEAYEGQHEAYEGQHEAYEGQHEANQMPLPTQASEPYLTNETPAEPFKDKKLLTVPDDDQVAFQDIDVTRKVKPAQLMSGAQLSYGNAVQSGGGSCQQELAEMNMMFCYTPQQLNNHTVLMQLAMASPAEYWNAETLDFDVNLYQRATTLQGEIPNATFPADQLQAEACKTRQLSAQDDKEALGRACDVQGIEGFNRWRDNCNLKRDKGPVIRPSQPLPGHTSFLRRGGLAFTPPNPVSKMGKAIAGKARPHPYLPQSPVSAESHVPRSATEPAVYTKHVASATVPPPAIEAGGLCVVTRMPCTVRRQSDRPLDPWAVEGSDRVMPSASEPPDVGAPAQGGPHAWPQHQESTNMPRFDLLL